MNQTAVNATAARIGMSPTTVATVIETYESLDPSGPELECTICGRQYATERGLVNHMKKVH